MEPRKTYDIDSLTDVALAVFAQRGYDGATMDDVARAAGITKASIYHHVSGKEALLERGLARALDALFAILDEPALPAGPPLARLRYVVARVCAATLELLPELSVLFHVRGSSGVERAALERRRAFDRIVIDLVRAAQADGSLRADVDARLATRLIFGMSNSVVQWYRSGSTLTGTQITSAVLTLAFEGLSEH